MRQNEVKIENNKCEKKNEKKKRGKGKDFICPARTAASSYRLSEKLERYQQFESANGRSAAAAVDTAAVGTKAAVGLLEHYCR